MIRIEIDQDPEVSILEMREERECKTVRFQLEKANVTTGTSFSKLNLSGSFHLYFAERPTQRIRWKQIEVFPRIHDTRQEVTQSQRAGLCGRSSLRQGPLGRCRICVASFVHWPFFSHAPRGGHS